MRWCTTILLSTLCILLFAGCGKKEQYEIEILVPAGSTESFVYSDEEICPIGNTITIVAGAGLGDTEVILQPVEVKEENAYEPTYLTHGMPVKMDVEKGGWFKIGVSVQNNSDKGPIAVAVEVEGVEVRIAEKAEAMYAVSNVFTNEKKALSEKDALAIAEILQNRTWNTEGTTECASNIRVTIDEITYKYHSDCGTFNDNANQRNLSLDDTAKEQVNVIIEEYVSLAAEEVPIS